MVIQRLSPLFFHLILVYYADTRHNRRSRRYGNGKKYFIPFKGRPVVFPDIVILTGGNAVVHVRGNTVHRHGRAPGIIRFRCITVSAV